MDALARRNVDLRGVIEDQCAPATLIRASSNGRRNISHEHGDSIIVRPEASFCLLQSLLSITGGVYGLGYVGGNHREGTRDISGRDSGWPRRKPVRRVC